MELESNDQTYSKKALKYYLQLKKISDDKIGLKLANHSLKNISKITNKKLHRDIIEETEEYCQNFIKSTEINSLKSINYNELIEIIRTADLLKINNCKIDKKDLYIFDSEGLTPLHLCIKLGDSKMLEYLLNNNISINLINREGNTLLEYACL